MEFPRATVLLALVLFAVLAGSVAAHGGDGDSGDDTFDHMDDEGHMAGWWSMGGLGPMALAYWVLAVPFGLLVYIDAGRRRMNAPVWFLFILIPWVGLGAALVYVLVRRDAPPAPERYDNGPRMPPYRDYQRGW